MNDKKILILTLSLGRNYGGMLQAYALQRYLKDQGHDVVTTEISRSGPLYLALRFLYRLAKRMAHAIRPTQSTLTAELDKFTYANTLRFVQKHIDTVSGRSVERTKSAHQYKAIIVGSDQVWRKRYVSIPTYLLDFADHWSTTRLSYAASFGKDDLSEYTPEDMNAARRLAAKFDAISVREDSAVSLIKENWGLDAEHHIDPTMLHDRNHYLRIVEDDVESTADSKGDLFIYVLDRHATQNAIISEIENTLGLSGFEILPPRFTSRKELLSNLSRYQYPPVSQWLKSFHDAEFVVTDSFHGTVFAILFHKPFITIGNSRRGLARFTSLLSLFNLEDRLVTAEGDVNPELLKSDIDWVRVDERLRSERARSHGYFSKWL